MNLNTIDWIIIAAFFAFTMMIGLWASKRAGKNSKEFFLSGRDMPWWLLGVSMVATTFSADTPNLVTDIVRQNGVAGNWVWWAFLLTGMMTVFVYAKLWRRSRITTDLEFYELRYSGPEAAFLRGFRALYLGFFFNVMIMATVLLAGIKIGGIMLGLSPVQTVVIVSVFTVLYSSLGGLRGVVMTDFFQFILSMIGMIIATVYIIQLPEIDGLANLVSHPNVADKINFLPDLTNMEIAVPLFFIPIAVQWWSSWYPGAEPGGGGYIAQRMLSAKNENDAVKSTLFFTVAHYAFRPWPWIIIALASLIIFPDLSNIKESFPNVSDDILGHDLAFAAMLTLLPSGLVGLLIASLIAALMSTISTHLNWGASYIVNDFYVRFINSNADGQSQVNIGRVATVALMLCSAIFALMLTNAFQAFNLLLQIGAGTGLLFLLRWFWWRINAYSEIAAMIASFIIAFYFEILYSGELAGHYRLIIGVGLTSIVWIVTTLITRPTNMSTLIRFYNLIRPHAGGWQPVISSTDRELLDYSDSNSDRLDAMSSPSEVSPASTRSFSSELLMVFLACVMVYAFLFGTGYLLYGMIVYACISIGVAVLSMVGLVYIWKK